jgi:hypothetical protein
VREVVLQTYLQDTDRAYILTGSRYRVADGGGPRLNAQQLLLEWYTSAAAAGNTADF